MKTARTRARTQSGARPWTSAVISEMKVIHAPPPTSMTAPSAPNPCKLPVATIVPPRIATPADTTTSVDHRERAHCMARAPQHRTNAEASQENPVTDRAAAEAARNARQQREQRARKEHPRPSPKHQRTNRRRVTDVTDRRDRGTAHRLDRCGP